MEEILFEYKREVEIGEYGTKTVTYSHNNPESPFTDVIVARLNVEDRGNYKEYIVAQYFYYTGHPDTKLWDCGMSVRLLEQVMRDLEFEEMYNDGTEAEAEICGGV